MCQATSWQVVGPRFRHVQLTIEDTLKLLGDVARVYADHAIVHFSLIATPLSLDACRVLAALGNR